jgi:hypothetical protein
MLRKIRSTFNRIFSPSGKNLSTVQVVDAGGNPVTDATVYVSTMNAMFRVLTDLGGFASLPGAIDKILSLQAEKPGLGYSEHLVFSETLSNPIVLALPKLEAVFKNNPDTWNTGDGKTEIDCAGDMERSKNTVEDNVASVDNTESVDRVKKVLKASRPKSVKNFENGDEI